MKQLVVVMKKFIIFLWYYTHPTLTFVNKPIQSNNIFIPIFTNHTGLCFRCQKNVHFFCLCGICIDVQLLPSSFWSSSIPMFFIGSFIHSSFFYFIFFFQMNIHANYIQQCGFSLEHQVLKSTHN